MHFHHALFLTSLLSTCTFAKLAAFNPALGFVTRDTCSAAGLDECYDGSCYNASAGDTCCDPGMCSTGFYCGTGINTGYCCPNGSSDAECAAADTNGTSSPTQEDNGSSDGSSSTSTASSTQATVTVHNGAVRMNEASLFATIAAIAGFALI